MLGETKLEVGSKLKIRKSAKVMSAEAFDFIIAPRYTFLAR